ncbi:MAG: peptide deformylase [Anaerolineales bacterium]|nr:peptide deformylase [Anaerolineales bacterium]
MTVRKILLYSEDAAALRRKSNPVQKINRRVQELVQDIKDTLMACPNGAGLAAPQINAHQRVVVVRLGLRDEDDNTAVIPTALINPEIIEADDERRDFDGCLSFPGLYATTRRPHYLKIKALDELGQPLERTFEDFDAILTHHEIDHLNGVLFIDRIEQPEDLYMIHKGTNGRLERVPLPDLYLSTMRKVESR